MPQTPKTPDSAAALPMMMPSAEDGAENSGAPMLVVGIGASAGGLDACCKFVAGLATGMNLAVVVIQHLGQAHASHLVDLLSRQTVFGVQPIQNGTPVLPGQIYVTVPGTLIAIVERHFKVSPVTQRDTPRRPFDYFLQTLARAYRDAAVAVVLSGAGHDGSDGIRAIREQGGLVIVQLPGEAAYAGMPEAAIATGAVDYVVSASVMVATLLGHHGAERISPDAQTITPPEDIFGEIIELVHQVTAFDLRPYKRGTLYRRAQRRMALLALDPMDFSGYLAILKQDTQELGQLAEDFLINVTRFFRDPEVFDAIKNTLLPEVLDRSSADQPPRMWCVGCSSGEEAYSIAMLCTEWMVETGRILNVQIFASDIDPVAIEAARAGYYPDDGVTGLSPHRLERFFAREDKGYRILPDLRSMVVFTVQDVLKDPPFSRLDLVICRNLLIYLRPESQRQVISTFHFALRPQGVLVLGKSETPGTADEQFGVLSPGDRFYRRLGKGRTPLAGQSVLAREEAGRLARPEPDRVASRQAALAELCRRFVLANFAPAAVLVNEADECLYTLGPTDRYLQVPPGPPTHDVMVMARDGLRVGLGLALRQARERHARVTLEGGAWPQDGHEAGLRIDVQPVVHEGDILHLICFLETRLASPTSDGMLPSVAENRIAALTAEADALRADLASATRNLEVAVETQQAIMEEAIFVKEEYQSTNEELLTSKEELQSLNEQINAVNIQLQGTLEAQKTTANDLQNVLYSTDVATVFLDANLRIRFFTPATKRLFNIIHSDVGRPLGDLNALAPDSTLLSEAQEVLLTQHPLEREIKSNQGEWYNRRILPYRMEGGGGAGVVITFLDITDRRHTADALQAAKRLADAANIAKSRFLAAASHDLRQPLQTLALLQGVLATTVAGERAQTLVARLEDTLLSMSGMLNTLLDINQIEAGTVKAEKAFFPVQDLMARLVGEFTYQAQAQALDIRMAPCSLWINSDPRLFEQMMRNLLSNALKYTRSGKVLLGCRRSSGGGLSVQVWDTGVGIPETELRAIFEEYHQLDNSARASGLGLGLGLSIVQRLGWLLEHKISVVSSPGRGSGFMIALVPEDVRSVSTLDLPESPAVILHESNFGAARILVVEDDPAVRDLLVMVLQDAGHHVLAAADAIAAQAIQFPQGTPPDLLLADYNLPKGCSGLELAMILRRNFGQPIPVIILTGDISSDRLSEVADAGCMQLNKPVKADLLLSAIDNLLADRPEEAPAVVHDLADYQAVPLHGRILLIDDDEEVRRTLKGALEQAGLTVRDYASSELFLEDYRMAENTCLLIDGYLPGMSGLGLLTDLRLRGDLTPAILITGYSDVKLAVSAMKAGASDFIEKPVALGDLLRSIAWALDHAQAPDRLTEWRQQAAAKLTALTSRQREVLDMVLAGHPSKNIAADLKVSQRTVENHRAAIMRKTGVKSLPALARLVMAAEPSIL